MSQRGLTPAEYRHFRERHLPGHPNIIFVLESPPKSGKYFYKPDGLVSEPLFSAMMKDVLEMKPSTKDEGLREFWLGGTFCSTRHIAPSIILICLRAKEIG